MNPLRAHWQLDPEITFLNHGSFGACPTTVSAVQTELRTRIEREPVAFFMRECEGLLDAARAALAAFVGAPADDIALVRNATAGVNTVLRSLELGPGDELLTTDHVYNACRNALHHVADRAGARVVVADVPFPLRDDGAVVDAVLGAVSPHTVLVLLDHITSPTGLVLPVDRIVAALRQRGVDSLVDGAHAPGMVELDLTALGATYYTGNCHKWLCTPKGSAFLYVHPDRQPRIRPLSISHGANSPRTDRSRFRLEFDWAGTDDPTPWLCIPAALEWLGQLFPGGWPELRRHNHELAVAGRAVLLEALGVAEAPAPESMLGSLAAVPIPARTDGAGTSPMTIDPLQDWLFHEHRIEVPVMSWPAAPRRLLRIAAQAYNHLDDYRRLGAALAAVPDSLGGNRS
ncbi:MAG: aminotransferase class V-fold PLP-dependent enzyme [Planctomycetes bacterium]|nr:aminotransferase class V-fold PLP-dependent enzyme [Planctomycetota bacterium]MCB9868846.1 aminotransferase class V-fold PLP-dependent enzyme [Planctomycetota bacterium]